MLTFEESDTNDFTVSAVDNLSLLSDQEAIVQLSRSVIERQLGEMQYLSNEGIPTADTLFDSAPNQLQYQFYCRQAISRLENVVSVDRFDTEITERGELIYVAEITTTYGQAQFTNVN